MKKILLILITLLLVGACTPVPSETTCETKECFIDAAQQCDTSTLEVVEEAGTILYQTSACSFTKTVVKLHEGDSDELKQVLEGKSLDCEYQPGEFNEVLLYSQVDGIENCNGELVEIIGNLLVFAL